MFRGCPNPGWFVKIDTFGRKVTIRLGAECGFSDILRHTANIRQLVFLYPQTEWDAHKGADQLK
ncbi:MAG: hypothetical protein RLY14_3027 [Planctomycetota bacterium]|jgi:hypothetical protein